MSLLWPCILCLRVCVLTMCTTMSWHLGALKQLTMLFTVRKWVKLEGTKKKNEGMYVRMKKVVCPGGG